MSTWLQGATEACKQRGEGSGKTGVKGGQFNSHMEGTGAVRKDMA